MVGVTEGVGLSVEVRLGVIEEEQVPDADEVADDVRLLETEADTVLDPVVVGVVEAVGLPVLVLELVGVGVGGVTQASLWALGTFPSVHFTQSLWSEFGTIPLGHV
eukprot:gb/GECG01015993.1/.p1 GENE.gb/GECG01015993.1/~~gb/GECG01015993.1/.p1  ORF type:complete len:106 (+),score=10.00 gb/GECG01015993.1/:1-318(+)